MLKRTYRLPNRIKNRKYFLRAAHNGKKFVAKGLIVQVIQNDLSDKRVGFTTTKKLGCAVIRNRVRRRLREICRLEFAHAPKGYDYVFVGRQATIDRSFDMLQKDARYISAQIQMYVEQRIEQEKQQSIQTDEKDITK